MTQTEMPLSSSLETLCVVLSMFIKTRIIRSYSSNLSQAAACLPHHLYSIDWEGVMSLMFLGWLADLVLSYWHVK